MSNLISRQAAIDAIEDTDWYHQNKNKDMVHGANSSEHQAWYKAEDVHKALEQLPSAQPEITLESAIDYLHSIGWMQEHDKILTESAQPKQKKGKWIIKDNPGTGWYRVTCSECGEDVTSTIPMIGFFPNAKPLWNYCPGCGAKMEEYDE